MNRIYSIRMGSLEINGLISPGELPDLISNFYRLSEKYAATPEYLRDGVFLATKGEVTVHLTIGDYYPSIPSKTLFDALEDMMKQAFQ